MEVIAIRDIHPDEEILTSYIDVSNPTHMRQAELKRQYGFDCDCPLCARTSGCKKGSTPRVEGPEKSSPVPTDPRYCLLHPGCKRQPKGRATIPCPCAEMHMLKCDACGEDFMVLDRDYLHGIDHGKHFLLQEERGRLDQSKALEEMSTLIPSLLDRHPPSSYPVLSLLRLHQVLLTPPTSLSHLTLLNESYKITLPAAELVYPPNHPVLAIMYAEWGKILAIQPMGEKWGEETSEMVTKRFQRALEVLKRAEKGCEMSFGKGGGVEGRDVRELRGRIELELGMMAASMR